MRVNIKIWKWLFSHKSHTKIYRIIPGLLGMQSITEDGKHVLFLDFDKSSEEHVVAACRALQERQDIGTFYVFESSTGKKGNNYHAVCLDKLTFGRCADICIELGMTKYMQFSALRGFFVLRVSPKKEHVRLVCTLPRWSPNKSSRCHYDFLKRIFDIQEPNNLDDSTELKMDIYMSVNK